VIADGSGVVGLETDDFTMNEHQELTRRLNVKLEDASSLVDSVMMIKEPAEIERMRRAAEVCDLAAEAVIKFIRPGVMETEIAGVVEQTTRAAGKPMELGGYRRNRGRIRVSSELCEGMVATCNYKEGTAGRYRYD
jgi:Xaa-Pro aminopeptidase